MPSAASRFRSISWDFSYGGLDILTRPKHPEATGIGQVGGLEVRNGYANRSNGFDITAATFSGSQQIIDDLVANRLKPRLVVDGLAIARAGEIHGDGGA